MTLSPLFFLHTHIFLLTYLNASRCHISCKTSQELTTINSIRADLPQLADRRELNSLTRRFFVKIADIDNCLNYLLPAQRDFEITRSARAFTLCDDCDIIHAVRIVTLSKSD